VRAVTGAEAIRLMHAGARCAVTDTARVAQISSKMHLNSLSLSVSTNWIGSSTLVKTAARRRAKKAWRLGTSARTGRRRRQ
jgi:hypothetical protein